MKKEKQKGTGKQEEMKKKNKIRRKKKSLATSCLKSLLHLLGFDSSASLQSHLQVFSPALTRTGNIFN